MYKYFTGIDVSKDTFDLTVIDNSEKILFNKKLKMTEEGFTIMNAQLSKYSKEELVITMESTGIYHTKLLNYLVKRDYRVSLVNPLLIKSFVNGTNLRKTKTDKKDARNISLFSKRNVDILRIKEKEELDSIKSLARERRKQTKVMSRLKTEIKGLVDQLFPELLKEANIFTDRVLELLKEYPGSNQISKAKLEDINKILSVSNGRNVKLTATNLRELARKSIGLGDKNLELILKIKINTLIFLQREIKDIEKAIGNAINDNDNIKSDIELLKTIRGIGDVTAEDFMLELETIEKFESYKSLTAYIGTDPGIKQSGETINVRCHITKRGNAYLRRTIYLMALGVVRYDEYFREYYDKKISEGKRYKQAIISVANKLIRLIFAMLKYKTVYEPIKKGN